MLHVRRREMRLSTLMLAVLVGAIVMLGSSVANATVVVDIPDPNLEAAVRDALSIPTGPITAADMETLISLNAISSGIIDLSGLEYATNLQDLNLRYNQIGDISPLSELTNLQDLRLSFNRQISDISVLSGLVNLRWLDLHGNQISDISVLSGLVSVRVLYLSYNRISDISALSGLTNLENLYLYTNQITDISALSGLVNLQYLSLYLNPITDISALAGLTNLRYLQLERTPISDISALSGLTNLLWMWLGDDQITDIGPLSGLTNLEHVTLNQNQISDVSALAGLTNLRHLQLFDNQLSDIDALSGLAALYYLDVRYNYLDLTPGSPPMTVIEALQDQGTTVYYVPQKDRPLVLVDIDIKPGSDPNAINLGSEGVIPVAILGGEALNVENIDQTTLQFEGNAARVKGKSDNIGSYEDVNGDGSTDLVMQFLTEGLDLTTSDTEGTLTGELTDGTQIEGTDSITVVPPQ